MTNTAPVPEAQHARAWNRYSAWVFLALMIALALFIRVHGISRESVWWDEFSSVVHLDPPEEFRAMPGFEQWEARVGHKYSPDFMTFWRHLPETSPQRFPFFYFLEYIWNRYVSASPDSLRIISLAFSMLTLLVLYLLGRDLFGATAGLIAALCFSLSPIHRYFAQEIREYAALTLLGLLSAYTFVHVIRTGKKKWWILHVVTNVLLLSSQLFAVCALPVEAVFLLLTRRPSVRGVVLWGLIHFLLVIPWALFVMTIEFVPAQATASYMQVPPLREFVGDVFADDCIGLTWQLRPGIDLWEKWLSGGRAWQIVNARIAVGWTAVGIFLLGVAWLLVRTSRGSWRGCREDSETRLWVLFLLMWLIIPPTTLYVASILLRPCIFPRYTIYASLALYPILGAIIAGVRGIWVRALCTGCLLLFYGYQQSLTFEGPARTDYKSAARYVRARLKPADCILVRVGLWQREVIRDRVFAYTLGPIQNIMSYADTDDPFAEMSDFLLHLGRGPQAGAAESNTVWVFLVGEYFDDARSQQFESMLQDRHLSFSCAEFGGIQHAAVYEVRLDPSWDLVGPPSDWPAGTQDDAALTELSQKGDVNGSLLRWRNTADSVLLVANADAYYNLALAFYNAKQYDSAWETINKWREKGGTADPGLLERLKQDSGRSR